jgi:hypothetical protein
MLRIVVVSTATIAATLVGAAALLFSPTSCACLSPAQQLLLQADLDFSSSKNIDNYSFDQIEKALNVAFVGLKVSPDDRHTRFLHCRPITKTQFECWDVLARSKLLERGYVVRINVDTQDNFQSATVRQYWAWL